jgi:hypothetical protein
MQAGRYLGALTRCNFKIFETCTKRVARQSCFGRMVAAADSCDRSQMFHFTNSSLIILVSVATRARTETFETESLP